MQNSKFSYLKPINRIILCAGHGAGDPGAVNGNFHEATQTILMTDVIAELLRNKGLDVVVVPHNLGLQGAIDWINARYKSVNDGWAIEIHRDSAGVPNTSETSNRMGVYGGDRESMAIANGMRDILKREGGSVHTWAREGIVSGVRNLAWIRSPKTLSHLIECGFMQGDNSDKHLRELARRSAVAIFEVFTGESYDLLNQPIINQPNQNIMYDQEKAKFYSFLNDLQKDELYDPATGGWIKARLDIGGMHSFTDLIIELYRSKLDQLRNVNGVNTQLADSNKELLKQIRELKDEHSDHVEGLELQIEDLETQLKQKPTSSEKPFWQSKKFMSMLVGVATVISARFSPEIQEVVSQVLILVGGYIGVQGGIDIYESTQK